MTQTSKNKQKKNRIHPSTHTGNTTQIQTLPQSREFRKKFQSNGHKKQAGLAILLSNKTAFKLKLNKG